MPGSAWLNFLILVCTAGVGLFSLMKDWENHQHPVRRYAVLVLILGGLIVCTGMGLFVFGMRSEEAALLPLGAILVGFFGMIVVALGLPRRSQEGGY